MPEDPQAFFEFLCDQGENITIVTPMTVLETMLNSGKFMKTWLIRWTLGKPMKPTR